VRLLSLLLAILTLLLPGCSVPQHCKKDSPQRVDTPTRQRQLLAQFDSASIGGFQVFVPKKQQNGPPVLVLHEMPALSPDVLELALRLSRQNYSVYVPLLWGKPDHNTDSQLLFLRYAVELRSSPRWRAAEADVDRPILDELASLCRLIADAHPKHRIGVIGNCITGVFPFALAARVPKVAAPIGSQPTLPITLSGADAAKTGLSAKETALLSSRIQTDPSFQMLGFRFAGDRNCRKERFDTFESHFGSSFLNGTIPLELYHGRDGMPEHPHAVLTECHSDDPSFATAQGWQNCLDFLSAKLSGARAQTHTFQPYK